MKRFKFRLQRVLDFRTTVKKEQERVLALKNMELRSAEERLEQIVNAQEMCLPIESAVPMAEVTMAGDYQRFLREALINQRVLVHEATSAVEDARNAYIEKAVEAEMLETLKQRRRDEYQLEKHRKERKELDEIATTRHRFTKPGEGEDNG